MSDNTRNEAALGYWREHLRLIFTLLAIWFVVPYVLGIFLAPALNNIEIAGYPLGFWFAQQGSIYVFVALIFVYVARMGALDRKYDVHEE